MFRTNLDLKKPSVLVLHDLSAAFDTVDHTFRQLMEIGFSSM